MTKILRESEEEEITITDPTAPEEADKILELLESVAGEKSEKYKLYLHRASEKNRAVAAAFLNKYPPETGIEQIFEDAQTRYKGGNFVLVAREGSRIFKKAAFSAEYDKEKDIEPPSVKASQNIDEAFDRISRSVEKSVLLDKVQEVTRGGKSESGMTQIVVAMMQSQSEMMKLLLPVLLGRKEERSSFSEMREMAIFLKNLQEGKIDAEGESSLTDSIIKALPALAEAFVRRLPVGPSTGQAGLSAGQAGQAGQGGVLPPPPGPGSSLSALSADQAGGPVRSETPDENKSPMAIAFNRVMSEIKFSLTLPETDKLYAHILDYVENYMPGSISEMLNQSEDNYVKWIMQFDPSFSARESFFRNVYKFAVRENNELSMEGNNDSLSI